MNNYNRYLKSFFGSIVFAIYINIGILVGWIEIVHQYRGFAAFIMIIIAWTAYKSGEEIGLPQGLAFLIGMAILFSHLIVLLLKGYITIDVTQQIGWAVSVGGWIKSVLFAGVSFLIIVILRYWILMVCICVFLFLALFIWYKRRFKPLHYAVIKGDINKIKSLIDKGVDAG